MEPAELPATAPWLYPALTVLVALVLAYRLALIHAAVSAVSRSRLRVMAEADRRRAA
ncbi:MAG: hypothetical protein HUU35_08660, partial [Armatimonadetes bacterium]|nr:hypothetical protein [Armatimonadota bacterium]